MLEINLLWCSQKRKQNVIEANLEIKCVVLFVAKKIERKQDYKQVKKMAFHCGRIKQIHHHHSEKANDDSLERGKY